MGKSGRKHTRAMVIYNPRSGRGNADLEPALSVFRDEGWAVAVREKRHDGEGTHHAEWAVEHGYDIVLAAGGDGTVNDVMSGLRGSGVALGVLPIGTMNICAREFGYSHRLDVVARQLVLAERHRVDVGHLRVNGEHASHFLLLAGLGLDAAVEDRTSRALKNRVGAVAIGAAIVRALPDMGAIPVAIELDGVPWTGKTRQIIIGNSRRYGGFANVTGGAYVDDGMLDICIFTIESPMQLLRQVGSLLIRQRTDPRSAEIYRASSIVVLAERALALEIDGSAVDRHLHAGKSGLEYRFDVEPGALELLAPRTYDGHLFQPASRPLTLALGDLAPVHGNGHGHHNGHNGHGGGGNGHSHSHHHSHHHGNGGKRMRVLAVGVDTIMAQKLKSGRVVTVQVGPHTRVDDGHGTLAGLGRLVEGDVVLVEGKKGHDGTLAADRIALVEQPAAAEAL